MATPGSLAISSLHRLQKIVCVISNGYPFEKINTGTRTALYHFSDTSIVDNSYHCLVFNFY